ncbi:hypothetical protein GCM10009718_32980 [Isoptericola halotolerans]|uniref:DUF7574 domain-containing protein n=1 Tax=Isoptericola halotolerans TaxID=300560 RepID=A0ABX2A6H0_9MICO|nr:hypothetical protein [Isoptericola halotolerans]NOV98186.1 hypothetical protein [Isoptericola halotolerans]
MSNVYYDPEKFGLRTLGELDFSSGSYEFDLSVVWTDGTALFWADDAGCSCPSPFESVGRDDLSTGSIDALRRYLHERQQEQYTQYVKHDEVVDFIARVRKEMAK